MSDLTSRMCDHDANRKWTMDNARRIDAVEVQVWKQANQTMEYELAANVPSLLAVYESKLVGFAESRVKALEAAIQKPNTTAVKAKLAGKFSERSRPTRTRRSNTRSM